MNKELQHDSIIYHIERLISIYDIYINLCNSKEGIMKFTKDISFAKENLLILLLSQLYSVFDKVESANSISDIKFTNRDVEKMRVEIVEDWEKIEGPIKLIRHLIGFHVSKNIKGQKKAAEQFTKFSNEPFVLIQKLKNLSILYKISR